MLRTSSPACAPAIINLFLFVSVNKTTKEDAINFLASVAEQPKAQQRVPSDLELRGSGAFHCNEACIHFFSTDIRDKRLRDGPPGL